MTRRLRLTLSPALVAGVVALALLAGPLLTGPVDAQRPLPLPVSEQNLDANGFIRVHEQGIAQVRGTVAVNGGTVAISNLPSALNVHQAPVVGAYTFFFQVADGTDRVEPFPTINATAIHLVSGHEVAVRFQSPMSSLTYNGTPNMLLEFSGTNGEFSNFVKTFTQPIPLNGIQVFCQNESLTCGIVVSIIGSSQ